MNSSSSPQRLSSSSHHSAAYHFSLAQNMICLAPGIVQRFFHIFSRDRRRDILPKHILRPFVKGLLHLSDKFFPLFLFQWLKLHFIGSIH